MTTEFSKKQNKTETVYTLESTTSAAVASVPMPMGGTRKQGLLAQEADKPPVVPSSKPRNFVAKNATTGGAGAHVDKKRAQKQGKEKHKKPFAESNEGQQLSVQQLATISDQALDNAYHYGRSTPGNTFGWQANLKSAEFAKRMIDAGETDIEKISDAIHQGWNVTARAFVQNPEQFDDTEKLRAAGKLDAKLQQREKLMSIGYGQLPDDEQEKDRVVARALLQAIKGDQDVAGGLNEFHDTTGKYSGSGGEGGDGPRQRNAKKLIAYGEKKGLKPGSVKVGYSSETGVYQVTGLALNHNTKYDWRFKIDPDTKKFVTVDAMQTDAEYAPGTFAPVVFDDEIREDTQQGVAEGSNSSPFNQEQNLRSKSDKELAELIQFWNRALEKNPEHKIAREQLGLIKMIRSERIGKNLSEKTVSKDVTEMDNRTPSGDRREQRAYSPEAIAQRKKEIQSQLQKLKKVNPELLKKLGLPDLPEPKEGVAEDHEIQMASSELQSIAKNAVNLLNLVRRYSEREGLQAWQQSKITKAADYLNSVLQSISGEQHDTGMAENFKDGKNPGRKGLAKRSGVNTGASVSSLRNTARHSSGEKQRMAHWLANMKSGRAKDESVAEGSTQKYEMMLRNGQVKKFVAKDDADARRIATGYSAKSVIRMKGNVPGDKIGEQGMAEAEKKGLYYYVNKRKQAGISRPASHPKAPTDQAWKDAAKTAKEEDVAEGERTMSRAAKGYEKYGKKGMQSLAKAGREGASEKKLDAIRDKHDNYNEAWSQKYKGSINCSHPKGFSQKAHCAGKKKHNEDLMMEMTCPDCGMCETHGNHMMEIKQRLDAKCWKGKHKEGTKIKGGIRVNNCVPNESSDAYSQRLQAHLESTLAEKIPANAPVDVYIKDFEKSNAPQFRGKTKEKRRQMAVAASYAAKNPSEKK